MKRLNRPLFDSKFAYIALLAALVAGTACHCPPGSVLRVHPDFSTTCLKCPEGCAICTLNSSQEPNCIFCEDGFYSTKDGRCNKCYENCANCIGSEMSECRSLKPGFFFDLAEQRIRRCQQEGCSSCTPTGQCYSCEEGFYLSDLSNGAKVCKACNIPNCLVCGEKDNDVKSMKVVSCSVCRSGFSQMNDMCEACPDNCQFCLEGSKECILCKSGFTLEAKANTCATIDVANCATVDEAGKCTSCENRFYLSEGTCHPCQKAFANCNFCKTDPGTKSLTCLSCENGFNIAENVCKKCPKKCNHCSADKCFACQKGYFWDEAKASCERCDLANCELCKSASVCDTCLPGFYYDEAQSQCAKCKHNCLRCQNGGEDCLACPFNRFTLSEPVKTTNAANNFFKGFLSLILGKAALGPNLQMTEMHMASKCVVECPKTYHGKNVTTDYANRRCVYDEEGGQPGKFQMPFVDIEGDLVENIQSIKAQYDQEIQRAKDGYLTNVKQQRNKECHFNGVLKREFKSNKLSYYICRCDPGYLGDNCQVSKDLYFNTQKKLADFMNRLQKKTAGKDRRSQHIFLTAMTVVNKFKLSRQLVEQSFTIVNNYLGKHHEAENKRKLYTIYDGLLLNAFDLLEDIQKFPREEVFADSFLQQELEDIQSLILRVVEHLNQSVHSFQQDNLLLPDGFAARLKNLNTHSFVAEEFSMANFKPESGFAIRNPNIDTSFHTIQQSYLWPEIETRGQVTGPDARIRVINFAAPLFELSLKKARETPLSNLVHVILIEALVTQGGSFNAGQSIKKLKIDFALNFLPATENILGEVSCNGFFIGKRERWVSGTAVAFNEDNNTVSCLFNVYYDINQFYFGVSIKGN